MDLICIFFCKQAKVILANVRTRSFDNVIRDFSLHLYCMWEFKYICFMILFTAVHQQYHSFSMWGFNHIYINLYDQNFPCCIGAK